MAVITAQCRAATELVADPAEALASVPVAVAGALAVATAALDPVAQVSVVPVAAAAAPVALPAWGPSKRGLPVAAREWAPRAPRAEQVPPAEWAWAGADVAAAAKRTASTGRRRIW